MNRREFVSAALLSAVPLDSQEQPDDRIALPTGAGYDSPLAAAADETCWVQMDLGSSFPIDAVRLYPKVNWMSQRTQGFPVRFRIESCDEPQFREAALIADQTGADYPDPADHIRTFGGAARGRYVRITVTRMRASGRGGNPTRYGFSLAKIDVLSQGKDIAEGRPIADSAKGDLGATPLTRPARPQGEGIVTDNPSNVTQPSAWRPPAERVSIPREGVRLEDGVLKSAFEDNIGYLLGTFTADELLKEFRDRAGKPNPPGLRAPDRFWQTDLAGSNAGRFLMGAGNALRWTEHAELRRRLDQVVAGIAECRQTNGYIMAYPEETIFYSERAAYTRAWVTHGLIEAGYAGNPDAFRLLRGYYDWFDQCPYLPRLLRGALQGVQGMIANTRMYFTPAGKPQDLQVIQRYFQENYWLAQLARRDDAAIWKYPYDRPHCYLITALEAYMDLYRATGERRYLDAAAGGWDLYHEKWEHVGGTIAICEESVYPPSSYRLHARTGELCGSSFWSFLSQRFHKLHPDEEKYAGEIEKSIYNVALANQCGADGIRYTAPLVGRKLRRAGNQGMNVNTCCEGQGTRLLGALAEFLYSVAPDGIYVNLFAASSIAWRQGGEPLRLAMAAEFPFRPEVELRLSAPRPARFRIRVRVPAWAAREMQIRVNGAVAAAGKPGSYARLDREWRDGDTIAFSLPMEFRVTRYTGQDRIAGRPQYAIEYGPILMALVGDVDPEGAARVPYPPGELITRLRPAGEPLHFSIEGDPARAYRPYWQVADQVFTCYPAMSA
ncbi:MAG: glycoside hydrolase family 127 protein [Acidobacteriia bacterium]|nr:glycoside hydrolase family 127 protein [Terriglobia bacterium]